MTRVDILDDFGGCVRSDGKVYSLVLDFDSTRGEPDALKWAKAASQGVSELRVNR